MLANTNFQIRPLPLIVFGNDVSQTLPTHIAALKSSSVLVVTDRGVIGAGLLDRIVPGLKAAGINTNLFDDVLANPTDENVHAGAARLRALFDAVLPALQSGLSD